VTSPTHSTTTRHEPSSTAPGNIWEGFDPRKVREWVRTRPWRAIARENQLPPDGDWLTWLILAGRGFGKTRAGAEWVQENVPRYGRWILAGATAGDLRDIMIEGESGILAIAREPFRPRYEPSKSRLTWPNGSVALLLSADEPERFRGKQAEAAWLDEVAAWRYPEAFVQLQMGLRLGPSPRQVITTTPRPTPIIRELIADSTTVVTGGSTYENRANLAPKFFEQVIRRYEGTRIGRQELHAELLTDVEGALWTLAMLDHRKPPMVPAKDGWVPDMLRVVVAIDPAVTNTEGSDETGIIVAGLGHDGRGYILADRSTKASPNDWARRAIAAYDEFGADRIVAEVNNGGDLVESVLRTVRPTIPYRAVHASKGKRTRAEPVSALYEQKRVSHVDTFAVLEDQLTTWEPEAGDSPDRLDALVWALTDLMLAQSTSGDFSLVA
jgi:predicted phage terminase large subunit-like protein